MSLPIISRQDFITAIERGIAHDQADGYTKRLTDEQIAALREYAQTAKQSGTISSCCPLTAIGEFPDYAFIGPYDHYLDAKLMEQANPDLCFIFEVID